MLVALSALMLAPDPTKGPKPPVITFKGLDKDFRLCFEVSNPNADPLPYLGYTSESFEGGLEKGVVAPLYRVEVWTNKAWKAHEVGWCDTGKGPVTIPAKGKATFTVGLPQGAWDEFKVGIVWYKTADRKGGSETAWSEGVTREAATPKK